MAWLRGSRARLLSWRSCSPLSDRRDDLVEGRTRTTNRLHALLRDLVADGAKRNLTATHAAGSLRTVHAVTRPMNTASP